MSGNNISRRRLSGVTIDIESNETLVLLAEEIKSIKLSLQTQMIENQLYLSKEASSTSTASLESSLNSLESDSYSFMMCYRPFRSYIWWYGFTVFLFQLALVVLIIANLWGQSQGTTPFDVPFNVSFGVHAGQILALLVGIALQRDITTAISNVLSLRNSTRSYWTEVIMDTHMNEPRHSIWMNRILFPNACKFVQGMLVLFTSFIIVIQSETIIDLFKDFAAMQVISELDNMAFWLSENGYCGKDLAKKTKMVKRVRLPEDSLSHRSATYIRMSILGFIFVVLLGGWGYIVHGQISGAYFFLKFPNCPVKDPIRIKKFNDGVCHGGVGNSIEWLVEYVYPYMLFHFLRCI
jgi:hypothetical protein